MDHNKDRFRAADYSDCPEWIRRSDKHEFLIEPNPNSQNDLGPLLNDEVRGKTIAKLTKNNEVVAVYPSFAAAGRAEGISYQRISFAAKHNQRVNGYYYKELK